jgi:transposase-like protein
MSNGSADPKNSTREEQRRRRQRRHHAPALKAEVLRKLLQDKVPLSTLCAEYDLQPTLVYTWLNALYDNLEAAVDLKAGPKASRREGELEQRVKYLEARVAKKDEVIAEISQEYVQLKKELGEP